MRPFALAAVAALIPATAIAAPVTYNGSQSTMKYNVPTTGGYGWTGTQYINGTKVIYDAATDSYTLRDTGSPTTTSTFTGGTVGADFTTYAKTSGGVTETFRVLNAANTIITLNYVTYGKWRRSGMPLNFNSNDTYVVFGTKTPRSAMPVAGNASYTTHLDGTFVNKDGVFAVDGSGNLNADFAAGTLTYDATATGAREGGGAGIAFGTMTGSGTIVKGGPAFSGSGGFNGNGYAMNIWGNFYGTGADAASEVGGNFTIRGDAAHRGNGTGAIVGN